jgi:starch synthase
MAARKAVIASRVGGLAEVVVDSVTGLLVPPGDPRELAGAISKLLRQPSLAEQMGRNGSQRVAEYFTMEKMAKRNEAYYYELAGG